MHCLAHYITKVYIKHTGSVVKKTTADPGTPDRFKYHFICTGKEKEITNCSLSDAVVDDSLCGGNMVATLVCDTGDTKLHILCYTLVAIITFYYRVSLISNTAHTQSCQQ